MTREWMTVEDEAREALNDLYWEARTAGDYKTAAQAQKDYARMDGTLPVEVVLPNRFCRHLEETPLLKNSDHRHHGAWITVLIVWAGRTVDDQHNATLSAYYGDVEALEWMLARAQEASRSSDALLQEDAAAVGKRLRQAAVELIMRNK